MEPIQTIDVTEITGLADPYEIDPTLTGLERAYAIDTAVSKLEKRAKSLKAERSGIVVAAIDAGKLVQEDARGNKYEIRDKGRAVRSLDLNLLWKDHPEAYKQIVKNARWEVDPFVAMGSLTEAEILECSVFSPEVMGQKFPDVFMRIATPNGGSAPIGDAQSYLGEKQIDACSTTTINPAWKLEFIPGKDAGLGKKARAVKGVQ